MTTPLTNERLDVIEALHDECCAEVANLLAEVRRQREVIGKVRALGEAWQARGDHMREFAASVPEDVRESLMDDALDWAHRARTLRAAIGEV